VTPGITNGVADEEGTGGMGREYGEQTLRDGDVESQRGGRGTSHGMTLPFQPLTVTFKDVRYFVPVPEVRLHSRPCLGCCIKSPSPRVGQQ
jgi:hypothetical protein